MRNKKKRIVVLTVYLFMLVSASILSGCSGKGDAKKIEGYRVGNTVEFGSYEQDGNRDNGNEPITWIVLAEDGKKRLLLAEHVLDAQMYNDQKRDVTWETCTLRHWLNNEFYHAAFSEEEQKIICKTTLDNPDNPDSRAHGRGGNQTEDYVFLLSISEAEKYMNLAETRIAIPTDYAKTREEHFASYQADGCQWWLRSPGYGNDSAAMIDTDGYSGAKIVNSGEGASTLVGIRPVIWISL